MYFINKAPFKIEQDIITDISNEDRCRGAGRRGSRDSQGAIDGTANAALAAHGLCRLRKALPWNKKWPLPSAGC
jgi:hypothetical protein